MSTIEEVYLKQDASDMFFNNEIVTKAYSDSIDFNDDSIHTDSQKARFISQVSQEMGVDLDDATIIVEDFLKRV